MWKLVYEGVDIYKLVFGNYGLDIEINVENYSRRKRRNCEERMV